MSASDSPPPPQQQQQQEWTSKTDRYYKAWSEQLKCREFKHLEAHQFYKRINNLVGAVGSLNGLMALFSTIAPLFDGCGNDCSAGTSCFGLKIARSASAGRSLPAYARRPTPASSASQSSMP